MGVQVPKVCVSINLRKTFNSINWEVMQQTLQGMGFANHFIALIMDYLPSPKFSVLIEGEPSMKFGSGRGLCQVDLLSPFLFNLIFKSLSQSLNNAEYNGEIDTYKLGGCSQ